MTLLEKQINSLSETLSVSLARLANEVSPKPVHRLRTTIRRIDSLIVYAGPDLSHKQERALDTLSAIRKRAGRVRDFDVQMELLGAIANTSTARDRSSLIEWLKRKRAKQAARLSADVRQVQNSRFFGHLQRIVEKTANTLVASGPGAAPVELAVARLSELAAKFGSHSAPKPRALHQVRIRLKMIRYLAELGEESGERQRLVNEIKSAQDALGAWHDWEALAKTAEKQFEDRVNCSLLTEVRALFAAKYSAATAAIAQLFSTYSRKSVRKHSRTAETHLALAKPA